VTTITVAAGQQQPVTISPRTYRRFTNGDRLSQPTNRGLEDQPCASKCSTPRDRQKVMMTPGDVAAMLNELGGMRESDVAVVGAASVRLGQRGRNNAVFLSDGLLSSANRCPLV
jgi:hypothetical protein